MQWLNEEQLIQRVVAILAPPAVVDDGGGGGSKAEMEEGEKEEEGEEATSSDSTPPIAPSGVFYSASEAHDNAGQLLVEIIRVSRYVEIIRIPGILQRFQIMGSIVTSVTCD